MIGRNTSGCADAVMSIQIRIGGPGYADLPMSHIDALWGFLVAGVVSFSMAPLPAPPPRGHPALPHPRVARSTVPTDWRGGRGRGDEPTPSLGGLAILAGIAVAGLLFLPLFGDGG